MRDSRFRAPLSVGGLIAAGVVWLIYVALVIAFWGVVAWGIVQVVQWLTAK